uniref:Uncharacterized protein n=1 Tax=Timema douglasi TaxID=61478 RepID=A0A7R8VHB5_TIMDO|nr:unnamed protein product [Timema douglasi]
MIDGTHSPRSPTTAVTRDDGTTAQYSQGDQRDRHRPHQDLFETQGRGGENEDLHQPRYPRPRHFLDEIMRLLLWKQCGFVTAQLRCDLVWVYDGAITASRAVIVEVTRYKYRFPVLWASCDPQHMAGSTSDRDTNPDLLIGSLISCEGAALEAMLIPKQVLILIWDGSGLLAQETTELIKVGELVRSPHRTFIRKRFKVQTSCHCLSDEWKLLHFERTTPASATDKPLAVTRLASSAISVPGSERFTEIGAGGKLHQYILPRFEPISPRHSAIMDCLVVPLQEKLEDWKKTVINLDKDHAKGKTTLSTPVWDLNPYLPAIGSLVQHERNALYHAATEAGAQQLKTKIPLKHLQESDFCLVVPHA